MLGVYIKLLEDVFLFVSSGGKKYSHNNLRVSKVAWITMYQGTTQEE